MQKCIIRNSISKVDVANLYYDEDKKEFTIEILKDAPLEDMDYMMRKHIEKGEYTIKPKLAFMWVQNRIVGPDRQNISSILRHAKMSHYDEYKMLVYASTSVQDDFEIIEVKSKKEKCS